MREKIVVSSKKCKAIENILDRKDLEFGEDFTFSVSAVFDDGYSMCIDLCGVDYDYEENSPWTQAVLYDNRGNEVCYTDPEGEFFGEWELEHNGSKYVVVISKAQELETRGLRKKDLKAVQELDEMSGFCLSQWLEDEDDVSDYAFGIFDGDDLVGYCSVGGADDVCSEIENDADYKSGYSLLLSDVYVLPNYRKSGIATQMLNAVMKLRVSDCENIYCEPSHPGLYTLYSKVGFEKINDYTLKRVV